MQLMLEAFPHKAPCRHYSLSHVHSMHRQTDRQTDTRKHTHAPSEWPCTPWPRSPCWACRLATPARNQGAKGHPPLHCCPLRLPSLSSGHYHSALGLQGRKAACEIERMCFRHKAHQCSFLGKHASNLLFSPSLHILGTPRTIGHSKRPLTVFALALLLVCQGDVLLHE